MSQHWKPKQLPEKVWSTQIVSLSVIDNYHMISVHFTTLTAYKIVTETSDGESFRSSDGQYVICKYTSVLRTNL